MAVPDQHLGAPQAGIHGGLLGQAAGPDARLLPGHHHEAAATLEGRLHRLLEQGELLGPTDEPALVEADGRRSR